MRPHQGIVRKLIQCNQVITKTYFYLAPCKKTHAVNLLLFHYLLPPTRWTLITIPFQKVPCNSIVHTRLPDCERAPWKCNAKGRAINRIKTNLNTSMVTTPDYVSLTLFAPFILVKTLRHLLVHWDCGAVTSRTLIWSKIDENDAVTVIQSAG